MDKQNNTVVISKPTLIVIGVVLLSVIAFIVWNNNQRVGSQEYLIEEPEVTTINVDSVEREFEVLEGICHEKYLDCYQEFVKLNPQMTSSDDIEYMKEYCGTVEEKCMIDMKKSLSPEILEWMETPEAQPYLREVGL